MALNAKNIVQLEAVYKNRLNGAIAAPPDEPRQPEISYNDKRKLSYFLVEKQSDYLDHHTES
jgi:hypothetical protein